MDFNLTARESFIICFKVSFLFLFLAISFKMSSSASIAASILKNMASARMTYTDSLTDETTTTAPVVPVIPVVLSFPPPDGTVDDADDADDACDRHYNMHNTTCGYDWINKPFSHSGRITNMERICGNFALFGLNMDSVINMMRDTSMVIGGGFMVNHILAMNGIDKPLCPSSDIDFYVYGGIPPIFTGSSTDNAAWNKYNSDYKHAMVFKNMVTKRFYELISPVEYSLACDDDDSYSCEHTESGDRIFTTGSKIRMQVLTYKATISGQTKKLNLVFSDTNMYDLVTKVDISLTAGFICSNYSSGYQMLDYHHAAPQHVIDHSLKWMEPESTHTPRQKERMTKYRTRYNLLEMFKMTTDEFISEYDTLPDENIHIELKGTEDELHSTPVVRRVLGMPSAKFSIAVVSSFGMGDVTVYSNFPTKADRAEYALRKALAHHNPVSLLPPRNPSLVMYDDDDDEE
jgi:hypothetical protein